MPIFRGEYEMLDVHRVEIRQDIGTATIRPPEARSAELMLCAARARDAFGL